MPLDPQAQMLCDLANAMPPAPDDATLAETVEQTRAGWGMLMAMGGGDPAPMDAVEDRDAGGVPVRVYRPVPGDALPILVFLHGGGWTIGNVEQYDLLARRLASAAGAIVVSVDYRLAPEHPFPAAVEDCHRAVCYVAAHAADFGGDPSRIAVAGDSAGGNLSAVCALLACDEGGPALVLQVLVYPVADCDFERGSYVRNATGYLLERDTVRWFFECYAGEGADLTDWRISPIHAAEFHGVAPAVVITAEFDPLCDEGEAYAARLRDAGVPVEHRRYDGMIHGFFGMPAVFDASRDAIDFVATELRRAFGTLDT